MTFFLFLCNCIPVFTIGAALTAMYDVVFRMDTGRETTGAAACFRSFRKYFKDLTPIWILFLLLLSIGCGNAVIFSGWDNLLGRILSIFSLVILCNTIVILGYTLLPAEPFQNAKRDTQKKRAAPEHRQSPQNPVNLREPLFFLYVDRNGDGVITDQ
ncbi:MAG: YesL family protein, partial [Alistipes sp.]|nr:YesL family protein [Alistipes sp.]